MRVFCKVVGKNIYHDKTSGVLNYNALISTSAFNTRDGFNKLEFYRCSVDEDLYNSLTFLDNCTCDLIYFYRDGRQFVIASDLEKME